MKQVKWFERKFEFTEEQNIFPSILERLWGTPIRLEARLKSIPTIFYEEKIDGAWSIKENAGHLSDIEPLWQGRFEDIMTGKLELRSTDLMNAQTTLANHNNKTIDELVHSFRQLRSETIHMVENLDENEVFKSALHPRLRTPMRIMDLFLFVADHDDHHLARISELTRQLSHNEQNV
jgi:uncharacterized damage-inducible protein DinB